MSDIETDQPDLGWPQRAVQSVYETGGTKALDTTAARAERDANLCRAEAQRLLGLAAGALEYAAALRSRSAQEQTADQQAA